MKNGWIIAGASLAMAGAILASPGRTYAQTTTPWYQTVIQKLSQRFGLKQADVKSVFDDARQERQAAALARFEEQLTQAVNDGKITESQKQLILTKHKEILTQREQDRDRWLKERQDLEAWAKQNNIDLSYFFGGHMMKPFGGMRGGWH